MYLCRISVYCCCSLVVHGAVVDKDDPGSEGPILKITINVCWDPLPRTDSSNRVDSDSRIAFLGLYILLCSSTDDGRMIIKDCI